MSLYGKTDSNTNVQNVFDRSAIGNTLPDADIIFVDNTEAALAENKQRGIDAPGWWRYYTFTDCEGATRHKAELLVAIADPESNAAESQSDDTVAADVASAISISAQPANQTAYTPAGSITDYTAGAGTTLVGEANEVYTLTGLAGSVAGTGAAFTVTRGAGGAISSVAIDAVGTGFAAAETITILGSTIGGVDTTDDLVITVDAVGTAAATFSVTASATTGSLTYQWQRRTTSSGKWTNVSGATSSSLALTGLTTTSDGYQYRVKLTSSAGAEEVISNAATLTVDNNIFA